MAICLDYAKMAYATYSTATRQYYEAPPGFMVDDWKVQKFEKGTVFGNGYQGAVYVRGREAVVSCCGTNPGQIGKLLQDLVADVKIALRLLPSQARSAIKMVHYAKNIADRVSVTGHSLGGGLAQICGVAESVPFVTFNAPAMKGAIAAARLPQLPSVLPGSFLINSAIRFAGSRASQLPQGENVGVNFRLDSDKISTHLGDNDHIGTFVMMPNVLNQSGVIGAHGKDNCWQAILESDWSHIDPFFGS
jgi:hypothetical protein